MGIVGRAIEGIDRPAIGAIVETLTAGFFGNDLILREVPLEDFEDQGFGGSVGFGDQITGLFFFDLAQLALHLAQHNSSSGGRFGGKFKAAQEIDIWHGSSGCSSSQLTGSL